MASYLLNNIHKLFPQAQLGIVIESRGAMIRDLLSASPHIEVVETNRRDLVGLFRLWWKFHGSDLVVTQYAGKHGGQFGLASKVAARILQRRGALFGFKDTSKLNRYIYNHLLPVQTHKAVAQHERNILLAAGLPVTVPYPQLCVASDQSVVKRFSLQPGSYVIVHCFAGNTGRSISPNKARELIQELIMCNPPGLKIVVSGGTGDRQASLLIAENIPEAFVVAGQASLQDMIHLISGAAGVVSVDTGIAHIAAHLRVPLVVMRSCLGPNWWFTDQYGPEAPVAQFSREDLCVPHVKKEYPDCLDKIDMQIVAKASCAWKKVS